jgi:hypothetical protein
MPGMDGIAGHSRPGRARGRESDQGPDPDDVRPRRVRRRIAPGGRQRLPAQGRAPRGPGRGDPDRGRGRGSAGSVGDAPPARPRRQPAAAGRRRHDPGPVRADRARARGAQADGPRPLQRRDRREAGRLRDHGQDPRLSRPGQARNPRPSPGRDPRLRDRPRLSLLRRSLRPARPSDVTRAARHGGRAGLGSAALLPRPARPTRHRPAPHPPVPPFVIRRDDAGFTRWTTAL